MTWVDRFGTAMDDWVKVRRNDGGAKGLEMVSDLTGCA